MQLSLPLPTGAGASGNGRNSTVSPVVRSLSKSGSSGVGAGSTSASGANVLSQSARLRGIASWSNGISAHQLGAAANNGTSSGGGLIAGGGGGGGGGVRRHVIVLGGLATACFLCYAIIKLPVDMKQYARRSAHGYPTITATGKGRISRIRKTSGVPSSGRVGGIVTLAAVPQVPVNHRGSAAVKQVIISRGQIPHLEGFGRAVVGPGQTVPLHSHK
jgi:hypothetical protein